MIFSKKKSGGVKIELKVVKSTITMAPSGIKILILKGPDRDKIFTNSLNWHNLKAFDEC